MDTRAYVGWIPGGMGTGAGTRRMWAGSRGGEQLRGDFPTSRHPPGRFDGKGAHSGSPGAPRGGGEMGIPMNATSEDLPSIGDTR